MKIVLIALSVLTLIGCTNDQVSNEAVKDENSYETTSTTTTQTTTVDEELNIINGTGSSSDVDI